MFGTQHVLRQEIAKMQEQTHPPGPTPTKTQFMAALRADLTDRYGWALDTNKLDRFMSVVKATLCDGGNQWNPDGPAKAAACRALRMDPRTSLKVLRALPL